MLSSQVGILRRTTTAPDLARNGPEAQWANFSDTAHGQRKPSFRRTAGQVPCLENSSLVVGLARDFVWSARTIKSADDVRIHGIQGWLQENRTLGMTFPFSAEFFFALPKSP
jgi:hypothetical protein